MRLERKRRIATAVLVALAVWPAVHRIAVHRVDVSPWRFFGWAMYCQPSLRPTVRIVTDPQSDPGVELHPIVHDAIHTFTRERHAWGRLYAPDDLAAAVMETHPHVRSLVIEVERRRLDPGSGRLTTVDDAYPYLRGRRPGTS